MRLIIPCESGDPLLRVFSLHIRCLSTLLFNAPVIKHVNDLEPGENCSINTADMRFNFDWQGSITESSFVTWDWFLTEEHKELGKETNARMHLNRFNIRLMVYYQSIAMSEFCKEEDTFDAYMRDLGAWYFSKLKIGSLRVCRERCEFCSSRHSSSMYIWHHSTSQSMILDQLFQIYFPMITEKSQRLIAHDFSLIHCTGFTLRPKSEHWA